MYEEVCRYMYGGWTKQRIPSNEEANNMIRGLTGVIKNE